MLGMTDRALDAVDRAHENRESFMCGLGIEGLFPLTHARRTERFRALMGKLRIGPHDVTRQRALLTAHEASRRS
jgi:hypothetical protein